MVLQRIHRRMVSHQPVLIDDPHAARAAVAMVLHGVREGTEILLIQRAKRGGDPWSGHMAFPGGHCQPDDPNVVCTAVRETREEVGIDLQAHGKVIGRLDEVRAMAWHRSQELIISPIVWVLEEAVALRLDVREVQSAVWVPLSFFRNPAVSPGDRHTLGGAQNEVPAYQYGTYTIWGLTLRMLDRFLAVVGEEDGSEEQEARLKTPQ